MGTFNLSSYMSGWTYLKYYIVGLIYTFFPPKKENFSDHSVFKTLSPHSCQRNEKLREREGIAEDHTASPATYSVQSLGILIKP